MSASRLRSFAEANARSFEALKQEKRWTPLSKSINYTTVAEVLRSLNPSKGNAHLATTIQATTPTMQRGGGGPKYGKVSDVHVEFYQAKHRVPNQSIPATQELRHQSKLQTMLHPLPSRKRSKPARLPQRTHEHTHTHTLWLVPDILKLQVYYIDLMAQKTHPDTLCLPARRREDPRLCNRAVLCKPQFANRKLEIAELLEVSLPAPAP